MPLNRSFVGKTYPKLDPWKVEAGHFQGYARATNTDNPAYFDEKRPGGTIAPPMYGVVYQFLSLGQPLFDMELGVNMMRLVHGEQDFRFHAPVRAGDSLQTTTTIKEITDKTSGELLDIALETRNQRGEKVLETVSGLFIRGRTRGAKAEERKDEAPPEGNVVLERQVRVDSDQSLRYADASGDHNPIHTDPEMARAAGLPDIVVHGLCSMAFVHHAVIDELCGADPNRLKRLKVRFAKPVLNGETLTLKGWEQTPADGRRVVAIEVYNPAGVPVIRDALAEFA